MRAASSWVFSDRTDMREREKLASCSVARLSRRSKRSRALEDGEMGPWDKSEEDYFNLGGR